MTFRSFSTVPVTFCSFQTVQVDRILGQKIFSKYMSIFVACLHAYHVLVHTITKEKATISSSTFYLNDAIDIYRTGNKIQHKFLEIYFLIKKKIADRFCKFIYIEMKSRAQCQLST